MVKPMKEVPFIIRRVDCIKNLTFEKEKSIYLHNHIHFTRD